MPPEGTWIVLGLKVKPFSPTSTIWVALDADPLVVGLAVAPVVPLEVAPPPYWALTRGSHKSMKEHKDVLIIVATELDAPRQRFAGGAQRSIPRNQEEGFLYAL
jgi:hypothetical protein